MKSSGWKENFKKKSESIETQTDAYIATVPTNSRGRVFTWRSLGLYSLTGENLWFSQISDSEIKHCSLLQSRNLEVTRECHCEAFQPTNGALWSKASVLLDVHCAPCVLQTFVESAADIRCSHAERVNVVDRMIKIILSTKLLSLMAYSTQWAQAAAAAGKLRTTSIKKWFLQCTVNYRPCDQVQALIYKHGFR